MNNREQEENKIEIPEDEIEFKFSHSSGPGGQNVNKRDTKVIGIWHVWSSRVLTDEQKNLIFNRLRSKINQEGNIVISSQDQRSQLQNKEEVIKKLNDLVNKALQERKKRIPTNVPRSQKNKRLEDKKRKSEIKKLRGKVKFNNY